jgi:hypothetical protein
MAKTQLLSLLLALAWFAVARADGDKTTISSEYDFTYSDPLSHQGSFRFDSRSHMGTDGHTAWHWYACADKFECLAGGPIRFTIPNTRQEHWDAFGNHFEIVGSRTERMLGQQLSVKLIKATQPAGQTLYVYSPERGLLGFGVLGLTDAPFFWLEEHCGFAARECH